MQKSSSVEPTLINGRAESAFTLPGVMNLKGKALPHRSIKVYEFLRFRYDFRHSAPCSVAIAGDYSEAAASTLRRVTARVTAAAQTLLWQPKYSLGNDVELHLRSATLDTVRLGSQPCSCGIEFLFIEALPRPANGLRTHNR